MTKGSELRHSSKTIALDLTLIKGAIRASGEQHLKLGEPILGDSEIM